MKEHFGLYLILTAPVAGYETAAKAAVDCGIRYLQLRMKDARQGEAIRMGQTLRRITAGTETRFIVNDDIEVAMACDADGIHLGQDDMPLAQARATWNRPGKIYGLSTHSMEQAELAAQEEPDYIGIGPVFPTPTKKNHEPALGTAETARIAKQTQLTSVAIGGISAENLPELLGAGIENFCVVGAVNAHPDPKAALLNLQKTWESHAF
mgnify:CR=1 FL=1